MTVYAMSSTTRVTVSPEGHGGCGASHLRPADENGRPVPVWGIDCPSCEQYLRSDPQWSVTIEEIVPTFDEKKSADKWAVQGARDQQLMLTAAVAQLAGFGPAQMPESLTRMLSNLKPHIPVAGQMVCPGCGKSSAAGQSFCGHCGSKMSAPAAVASITSGAAA
jgi:hypothetical protein